MLRGCGDALGGTVPLLPVTVGSEAWVPNRAVGSGGMGCRGGVVDGGGVVGASGGGDRQTHTHKNNTTTTTTKMNQNGGSYTLNNDGKYTKGKIITQFKAKTHEWWKLSTKQ